MLINPTSMLFLGLGQSEISGTKLDGNVYPALSNGAIKFKVNSSK
jgi:hypothetical protein